LEALRVPASRFPDRSDEWLDILRNVLELYRKLIIASKIVRPNTAGLPDNDVALEGIDYTLLAAVSNALSTGNISSLRAILAPNPSSVR
jgi:hypothetical protein